MALSLSLFGLGLPSFLPLRSSLANSPCLDCLLVAGADPLARVHFAELDFEVRGRGDAAPPRKEPKDHNIGEMVVEGILYICSKVIKF